MSSTKICRYCGSSNAPEIEFCTACGAELPPTPPPPPPTITYQPPEPVPAPAAIPACPICGSTVGRKDAFSTGWFLFWLCCIGIIPGIIYFALRHGKIRCISCNAIVN